MNLGVRAFGAAALAAWLVSAPAVAGAQTTVTLDAPGTEVTDAFIRGGRYGTTVHNTGVLATAASSNLSDVRRALLKFDTETWIPRGAKVHAAKLTLTLKASGAETRHLSVRRVVHPFQETQATWFTRKSGYRWMSNGGDYSSQLAAVAVGATHGTKITLDLTALVQATVDGDYSSRYTRVALLDIGRSSAASYKEFYSSEATDPTVRPVLTVTYGPRTPAPAPQPTPQPKPQPAPGGGNLTLLNWNTHYGQGTDGRYDLDRIASVIAKADPDVVSLNEVTHFSRFGPKDNGAARYAALLEQKTGHKWHYHYRTDNGSAKGVGNVVLSRFPIASTSYCQLSGRRVAVHAAIHVNGRLVNVWSTHLDSSKGNGLRLKEVRNLVACTSNFAEQRIIAGDFNSQHSSSELALMKSKHYDAWAEAAADRTAWSYPGNSKFGATRNSRIDYVFYSKGAQALVLRGARVLDTRDARGRMPSDHKPLVLTFDVR